MSVPWYRESLLVLRMLMTSVMERDTKMWCGVWRWVRWKGRCWGSHWHWYRFVSVMLLTSQRNKHLLLCIGFQDRGNVSATQTPHISHLLNPVPVYRRKMLIITGPVHIKCRWLPVAFRLYNELELLIESIICNLILFSRLCFFDTSDASLNFFERSCLWTIQNQAFAHQ